MSNEDKMRVLNVIGMRLGIDLRVSLGADTGTDGDEQDLDELLWPGKTGRPTLTPVPGAHSSGTMRM